MLKADGVSRGYTSVAAYPAPSLPCRMHGPHRCRAPGSDTVHAICNSSERPPSSAQLSAAFLSPQRCRHPVKQKRANWDEPRDADL